MRVLAGAGVELFLIVLQAARGRRSHFNFTTSADAKISGIMAVMALLFIGMLLPLAWEIARRPRPGAPPLMVWAITAGLVATFLLGGLTGAGMGQVVTGTVTPDAVQRPLPASLRGGLRRSAHFFGVHAMQAFPLMAAAASLLRGRTAAVMLVAGAVSYAGATLTLLTRSAARTSRPDAVVGAMPAEG